MRVMVASEHALLREGLRDLLKRWSEVDIVGVAPAAGDAVLMASRLQPDILLLVCSESLKSDAAAVAAIRAQARKCRIVSLDAPGRRRNASDTGADQHVASSVGFPGLVRLMWELCRDARSTAHKGATTDLFNEGPREDEPRQLLTRREYEVVQAVCQGLTNKQVGRRLKISEKTVKNHLSSVYRRIDLTGRTDLVAWAMRRGLAGLQNDTLPEGSEVLTARPRSEA